MPGTDSETLPTRRPALRRNFLPILVLSLFLGAFGAFAYFSQNPDSPWLMKAETWPRVGDWVRQFRQAYQAAPEEPTWKPPKTEVVVVKAPARKGSDGHEGLGTIHMVEPGAAAGFSATRSEPLGF